MIAVIADDFTGAAELAGICLRYNLSIQLALPGVRWQGADVLIVCTNSRSLNKKDALEITRVLVAELITYQPSFFYKKIDSVLRGYVVDELKVQAGIMGLNKIFILPANPSLGRTLKGGNYFIDGKEVHYTAFAADPEFAITDSSVLKILNAEGLASVVNIRDNLPEQGIVIGESSETGEIRRWADKLDNSWLLAGAGDFFSALMDKRLSKAHTPDVKLDRPYLYVSGTSFERSRDFIYQQHVRFRCVMYMGNQSDQSCINEAAQILREQQRCVVAIPAEPGKYSAFELRTRMAALVAQIIRTSDIKEMFIEGGATAAAILQELNIKSLTPVNELMRGVVRMRVGDLFITVKPGSYELPPAIKEIYS